MLERATANDPGGERPADPTPERGTFTAARLWRGIFLFLLLTALGLWVASRRQALGRGTLDALRGVHVAAIAIGCLQALLDQVFGGLRIWFAARGLGEPVALWPCILANTANVFLGGVTPSQHGGGPGQIWILMRSGMRFSGAVVTSWCTYLSTVTFFFLLATFLASSTRLPAGGALRVFTQGTLLLFGGTVATAIIGLRRPDWIVRSVRAILRRVPHYGARLAASAPIRGLERLFTDYSVLMKRGLRRGKLCFLAVGVLAICVYLNKFLIGYVILRGLGLHASVHEVLELQAVQALLTYFAPTPGASGVAEVTAAEIMRQVVPAGSMGAYIVLWRTMSLYLGMLLGGIVVVGTGFASLRPRREKRASVPASD